MELPLVKVKSTEVIALKAGLRIKQLYKTYGWYSKVLFTELQHFNLQSVQILSLEDFFLPQKSSTPNPSPKLAWIVGSGSFRVTVEFHRGAKPLKVLICS